MVVNSREHAPKPKNNNIVVEIEESVQTNVFFISIVFVVLACIVVVHMVDNIVCICEGKRLCGKQMVFGDFLAPCNLLQVLAKNTHIGISTSWKCEYQSGSLLI